MHGGPIRQMLLGWHYMYYYANSYAMNEYLASRGYVVLSVNYRSGIGYGGLPRSSGSRRPWRLRIQRHLSPPENTFKRAPMSILRASACGEAAMVAISLRWFSTQLRYFLRPASISMASTIGRPTIGTAKHLSGVDQAGHESSPVTSVETWKSPVLFIHGDDDRNVYFAQTVDLVARLRARGVIIEQLVFPEMCTIFCCIATGSLDTTPPAISLIAV